MRISDCGLDPFKRDDGIHPHSGHDPDPPYNSYLRSNNLGGDNPWENGQIQPRMTMVILPYWV